MFLSVFFIMFSSQLSYLQSMIIFYYNIYRNHSSNIVHTVLCPIDSFSLEYDIMLVLNILLFHNFAITIFFTREICFFNAFNSCL